MPNKVLPELSARLVAERPEFGPLVERCYDGTLPITVVDGVLMFLGLATRRRYPVYLHAAALLNRGVPGTTVERWVSLDRFHDPAELASEWNQLEARIQSAADFDDEVALLFGRSLVCLALAPSVSANLHRAMTPRLPPAVSLTYPSLLALAAALHAVYAQREAQPLIADPLIAPHRETLDALLTHHLGPLQDFSGAMPNLRPSSELGATPDDVALTLLECSPVGVIRLDHDGRIVYENPATRALLGAPTDQPSPAMGMRIDDLPNVRALKVDGDMRALLDDGVPFERRRVAFTSLFGRRLSITVEGRPIVNATGQRTGTVVVLSDVTREAELEAQLIRAQKLEIFGSLVGHVAHDLNNVLVGVRGHASLLVDKLGPNSPHIVTAGRLDEAAARMAAVVDGLLALANPGDETGADAVECADQLRHIVELLGGLLPRTMQLQVDAPEPVWCRIGAAHLQQVVINICVNARDGILARGPLESGKPGQIRVELRREGEHGLIAITDNGVGMDPITRAQVFDPLFTTKAAGEGTGLGMPVSLGLVRSYGGTIECHSNPGRGTTFMIRLPLAPSPLPTDADDRPSRQRSESLTTVLVVEDHDVVRRLCVHVLEADGYRVVVARNGNEALERAASESPALAVVDVGLPDIDGRLVARRLAPVPVLLTSGNPPDLKSMGGDDLQWRFLKKPYQVPELLKLVDEMLR